MTARMDVPSGKNSKSKRRRIWEIDEGRICSVIGTCLRCSELRKLSRKKQFGLDSNSSDYKLHSVLVNQSGIRSPISRTLNKILDTKYRQSVNRYAKAKDDSSVRVLWCEDVASGRIPGAYWAIVTHPSVSGELMEEIYGQIHMMGHEVHGDYQKESRVRTKLREKAIMLEEVLVSERHQWRQEKSKMEEEVSALRMVEQQCKVLQIENEELQLAKEMLESEAARSLIVIEVKELKQELDQLRQLNASLYGKLDELTTDLEDKADRIQFSEEVIANLEEVNSRLVLEKEDLQQEMVSIETSVLLNMTSNSGCESCLDQNTEHCPGPDLCGQKVLYVGGQRKMIPHYKRLVENHGGRFIHHDGGKEVARAMLPKMLATADVVLCPVDCVSHDACICVKKICKQYQKPFVLMRSSGLSSLVKGIGDIVQ